jgi:lipopolysaccharide transport system ATP-binding protein
MFLNGAILGMTRVEIMRKFDEIVAFAEVEKFLDMPVKRFSSGMHVRLAFAVAAHLDPEIMIVDEVLAVGDAEFQKKCLGKMQDVSRSGRTVLFVSHNMAAVRSLCERGIVLRSGRIVFDGNTDGAISEHLSDSNLDNDSRTEWLWPNSDAPGNSDLRIRSVRITGNKSCGPTFRPDEDITLAIQYQQAKPLRGIRFMLRLLTMNGEVAFTTTDQSVRNGECMSAGRYETRCVIPAHILNRIGYVVQIYCSIPGQIRFINWGDVVGRLVVDGPGNEGLRAGRPNWSGVVCPKIDWKVNQLEIEQEKKGYSPANVS